MLESDCYIIVLNPESNKILRSLSYVCNFHEESSVHVSYNRPKGSSSCTNLQLLYIYRYKYKNAIPQIYNIKLPSNYSNGISEDGVSAIHVKTG